MVTGLYSVSVNYFGNGSVQSANDNYNGNWTYTYDAVDRLQTATVTGQSFTYIYTGDGSNGQYGNMTCTNTGSKTCTPLGLTFNAANNRINDATHSYDLAGNMTADGTHGYVYDGESRVTCILGTDGTCTSASATVYYYDADGRRVAKYTGTGTVIEEYVYDLKGDQSSAHDGSGALIRAELYSPDGRHVATWKNSSLTFHHSDWLGTERMRTNSAGAQIEACSDTPYGMNLTCAGTDISPMHFTGKQLDTESNNTYFGARYFATNANLARFMTPDWSSDGSPVPYAKLDNPQTLNLYVYMRNNPLNAVDPDGHAPDPQKDPPNPENPNASTLEKKNNPVNSVTILGQKVDVKYDPSLSPEQQLVASDKIKAAVDVINKADLSNDEKQSIQKIKSISVSAGEGKDDPRTAPSPGGNENIRFSYLTGPGSTAAWMASALAHDAYHLVTDPKGTLYGPDTATDLEKRCNAFQMKVGAKFGLTQDQLDWIKNDTHTLYNTNSY